MSMPLTEYESAYLQHLSDDLAFRKGQETAMQVRHEASIKATDAATAAQNARADAERAIAVAGSAAAEAQRFAAEKLAAPTFDNLLQAVVARLDDRTGTGKTNAPLAVSEVLEAHAELMNRLAAGGALPASK
jgi:ribosomal protein L17